MDNINFVKDINPKTGELIGRRDLAEGKHKNLCPSIAGGYSWNSGSYNPKTGLFYKVGYEWCIDLEVVKTKPVLEPMAQLNIGADFKFVAPEGRQAARPHPCARPGHRQSEVRDPLQRRHPPHASLLTTGGNLLFVPDADGTLRGLRRDQRQEAVDAQQRPGPQRRHHQLHGQGQAVRRGR